MSAAGRVERAGRLAERRDRLRRPSGVGAASLAQQTRAAAHVSLGLIASRYEWDWEAAQREFQAALAVDANLATAHLWFGTPPSIDACTRSPSTFWKRAHVDFLGLPNLARGYTA